MDYGLSDSSGTDDDLPPPHQNKFRSAGPGGTGNGRTMAVGPPRIQNDMETQIHLIEQEAYTSVLRAFKAQSDAITWEMETLITDLRKELRVSDEEHRKLLSRVNGDDIIKRIREWRKTNGAQPASSHKKQKTSQSGPSSSLAPPPPALHHPMPPSSSAMNRSSGSGSRGKKPQPFGSASFNSRDQGPKQGFGGGGGYNGNGVDEDKSSDPLIGRKVWTRWPEDSNFYEAVITDFNPVEGRHALVYDANTPNEAWEWVNLREISPNDIRWKWEDVGASNRGGRSGTGRGNKNPTARGETAGGSGRGRAVTKGPSKKEPPPSQKALPKRPPLNDIELLHTDTLVREMDKVLSSTNADPMDIEKARKVLKEHEEALLEAIAKLEGASDGESEQLERQSVKKHEAGEGSDGNKVLAVDDQTNGA